MKYPSIRIEGAILSADILDKIEQGEIPGQKPSDFGFDSSFKVKDEIVRAWTDAQDYWRIFRRKLEGLKAEATATSETRNLWIVPLLGLLGYELELSGKGEVVNAKNYAISHRMQGRDNLAVHIMGYRDSLDRKRLDSGPRMSPHALVQEYLNLTEHLYAVVTNGQQIRLLRDSSRLIKLSFLEFDLERMMEEELFADFALFFRLMHASRLPVNQESAATSIIERYHQDSLDSGSRIRDGLSQAVEKSILALANGFLSHPDNTELREALSSASLTVEKAILSVPLDKGDHRGSSEIPRITPLEFYQWQLRLIYRLLFLMVIEERDLIYLQGADRKKKEIYYSYYSINRLRRLSEKRHFADRNLQDYWSGLKSVFRLFEDSAYGEKLGIAPLAGDLFDYHALGLLNESSLDNQVVLNCLKNLTVFNNPGTGQLIRVNYAALNVEEFGSVYEGLLEFDPHISEVDGRLEFSLVKGDARSSSGSHYTPDELVQPLIKHSLDFIIADKLKEIDQQQALLSIRVCDVACGSGHILLNAARRIATELAVVRTGEEQPSPSAFRHAVRDVIRHCIYGVDLNPLAVELCKVALWLEAHNPGEPLNFLNHHIKCGNAIVGLAHKEELERGIPDEAFKTLPGDDKEVASEIRKRNQTERKRTQEKSFAFPEELNADLKSLSTEFAHLASMPERNPQEIEHKKTLYRKLHEGRHLWNLRVIADIQVAQFFIPRTDECKRYLITDAEYQRYLKGEQHPTGPAVGMAMEVSGKKRFFHWFLEFPDIFDRGGFDCILGNPPYLGGQALSGTFGHPFCQWVKYEFAPAGSSDLVVYFLRRIYEIISSRQFLAIITTNSIKDGDVRQDGLEVILSQGGSINFAVRAIKWPGRANLYVSLLGVYKGTWAGEFQLDGRGVAVINPFLDDVVDLGPPHILSANDSRLFQGCIVLGEGFLLDSGEAARLIESDPRNGDVILPVINGEEVNRDPEQAARRRIINFFDWSEERARRYSAPFQILCNKVKAVRQLNNRPLYRDRWWIYAENRPGLIKALRNLKNCFVTAATTKFLNFSVSSADRVFTHALFVFTSESFSDYSVLQSTLHEVWARKYSGALETRLRYSPTDCFETFPFPSALKPHSETLLEQIGERYHEYRRQLMLKMWLGLTKTYNLFHDPELTIEAIAKESKKPAEIAESAYADILRLRTLHKELDEAVLAAYGWDQHGEYGSAVFLRHDFYEVDYLPENDRIRYTIHPDARREILKRLLQLNHTLYAEEAARGLHQKKKASRKPITQEANETQGELSL